MSSSNKRERELARAKYERQQQRRSEREVQRKRRNQIIAVVAALVVVAAGVAALLLSNRDSAPVADSGSTPTPTATASASTSSSPSPTPSGTVSVAGCTTAPKPTVKTATWPSAPTTTLPTDTTTLLTLATNCGDIVIAMNPKAPKTTASMAFLAEQGFYTDASCFRLTTLGLFVLQCGSPNNDGTGGPGYTLPDENLPAEGDNNYPAGTVAMANAGAGTAGSQFFIVYKDTTLPAGYTIWGTVESGLDVVTKVAEAGVAAGGSSATDGPPAQSIVITKATTSEKPAG